MSAFFGELYLRSTLPFLTPAQTEAEVRYLQAALGRAPEGPVLDVGCGHGRHACRLTGRTVIGLELDPLSLAQREGRFPAVRGDFHRPPFKPTFAAAIAWYSTLAAGTDAENAQALAAVAGCLKEGGLFLAQSQPRSFFEANPRAVFDGLLPDGARLREESAFDPASGRDVARRRLISQDGRELSAEFSVRYYSPQEWSDLLGAAGLSLSWLYGDLSGGPVGRSSRDLLIGAVRQSRQNPR